MAQLKVGNIVRYPGTDDQPPGKCGTVWSICTEHVNEVQVHWDRPAQLPHEWDYNDTYEDEQYINGDELELVPFKEIRRLVLTINYVYIDDDGTTQVNVNLGCGHKIAEQITASGEEVSVCGLIWCAECAKVQPME